MNLLDHRLATIHQVGIALAARMLESTASAGTDRPIKRKTNEGERDRAHRAAAQGGCHAVFDSGLGGVYDLVFPQ